MVAVAGTVLEAIGARLLVALGVGTVAGVAGEAAKDAARKRTDEADKAKATPIARAEAQSKAKEKCKECPPDKGKPFQRNFKERKPWVDYQARITGMPSGPNFIMEWDFAGIKFDGFVSNQCLLQDAKAGYDQFFNKQGEFNYDFQAGIFSELLGDAVKQNAVAAPKPPVQLRWYFMEAVSYRYMQKILRSALPQIDVVYSP